MVDKKMKQSEEEGTMPTVLVILDGFGLTDEKNPGNAITKETAPHLFSYMEKYPYTTLVAHGKDVGLFAGQEGNSEAGHLNIGAGRVVEQDLLRISEAIDDGTFYKNTAFLEALHHAKKYNTAVHVMGLLTNGESAHAHPDHLYSLLDFFHKEGQKKVYLHLFTDGRDSPPHSAVHHLKELRSHMNNGEEIASVMGRFYAMDRNKIWTRTERAYEAMVLGKGSCTADCAENAIAQAYNRGETDEYICPTVIAKENGEPVATIKDNDVIYFFNARSDRARQITKAFVQEDFQKKNPGAFKRDRLPKNIRFVAMTDFGPDLPGIFTAFPSPDVDNALAKAIGERYRQLYISETEKYAHVTYFINGGHAEPINGEDRELISSGDVYSYAERPQMHAHELVDKILGYMKKGTYQFVCVNFPNADMVGHTGDFEAAKKAVRVLDTEVARLVEGVLSLHGQVMIVADHGNAEEMINMETGEMMTEHTKNPVPCIVIREETKGISLKSGRLADVAPTLMKLLDIPKPKDMTGKALF
ncbi:MAG TPA: 2,3-bisphosphoglycerate-independent phosphoglycerate mutase [Candidatus Kapabacteria bacterium]|nr:2,3-bisphosphoglycerate-independent phosphoglycerate mutase [Candidatus Kapabacteria bacterium]